MNFEFKLVAFEACFMPSLHVLFNFSSMKPQSRDFLNYSLTWDIADNTWSQLLNPKL